MERKCTDWRCGRCGLYPPGIVLDPALPGLALGCMDERSAPLDWRLLSVCQRGPGSARSEAVGLEAERLVVGSLAADACDPCRASPSNHGSGLPGRAPPHSVAARRRFRRLRLRVRDRVALRR